MDIFGNFGKLHGDRAKRRIFRKQEVDFSYSDITLEGIAKVEQRENVFGSQFTLKAVVVLIFCLVIMKIFSLQIVKGEVNQNLAEGNRIRPRLIEASRGLILDKDGEWLVRNKPDFALALFPSDLPKNKESRQKTYEKVAEISGLETEAVKKEAEKNSVASVDAVIIKDNLEIDEALLLEEKTVEIPGVFVAKKFRRDYLTLPGMAHILGYTGLVSEADLKENEGYYMTDRIGKTGLEYQYEKYLKGTHGVEQIEVDSFGNIIQVLVKQDSKEPVAGKDILLYLDKQLQEKTALELKSGMEKGAESTGHEVSSGVAIVMDVNTGGVLSMVSIPDFDNNIFTKKMNSEDYQKLVNDPAYPMFNRAIKGTYPPGSIVKIIVAAAGLTEGNINLNTAFDTPEAITIGEYRFPDWKDHGVTDIKRAIAESNNIFFYTIGGGFENIKGLGVDVIKKYWQRFGLGRPTGLDLPGEASGLLPDSSWKKEVKDEPWYLGDTYHASIGQGDLLVTPIQMIKAVATVANGGKLITPQLVERILDDDGNVILENPPKIEQEKVVSESVLKTVREGMRMTITDGSARGLNDLPFSVAGKTGTAQFFNNEKTHAWFTAFAPYENPEVAIIVLVEGGGGGNDIAAPVAKEILRYYFENK